jgi:hypothetical protein
MAVSHEVLGMSALTSNQISELLADAHHCPKIAHILLDFWPQQSVDAEDISPLSG